MKSILRRQQWCGIALALALVTTVFVKPSSAQDSDDPPARVARLGYIQGSVSFRPAGEDDWVGAVPNRPMTTGDSIWADENSRAEVQLGSAVIRLAPMSGFSFLNLDDNTVQIQLTSGALNVTVRRMDGDDNFEVDTPNLAFSALQPGHYRLEASNDGNYTVVSVRQGEGEADGGGQSFPLRAGQRGTFSSSGSGNENDQLYADVEAIYQPDDFDVWSQGRDHRYESARSAQYLSPDVVGYDDLDENGDWRDDPQYGHVWFPHIEAGWAPYHAGHWAWIAPWGWTWVDDASWGYAPFHYGRWVFATGRWGWIAGPLAVRAVYAPALVVFIGGGPGGFGGNVGWFPLGPREVYVPSYHVSAAYVNRVNVSNTTVNVTQVTNVYNTTIVRNTTVIQNVTYVNRGVRGGVTAVPQAAFVSAQPVARAAVVMNAREINAAPVSVRMAMVPTHASVVGPRVASGTVRVAAPPAAMVNRQVVAKRTPPPPPVSFARQQQALAAHPGEPLARNEVATLRPAAMAHPAVKVAPPAKPATPNMGRPAPNTPAARPGNPQPAANPAAGSTGGRPAAQPNQPMQPNRPENNRPANAPENNARPQPNAPVNRPQPNQPQPNQPQPIRPQPNQPQPNQPANRPENTAPARPATPPANPETNRPNQPNTNQPNNRPQPNRPEPNRPQPDNRPETNRPVQPTQPPVRNDRPATPTQPLKNTPPNNQPPARPQTPPPAQPRTPPPAARPTPPPARQQPQQKPKPQTPEEKKRRQEEKPSGV